MFSAVQCSAVHCIAALYTTVNFNSVQRSALLLRALHYNIRTNLRESDFGSFLSFSIKYALSNM